MRKKGLLAMVETVLTNIQVEKRTDGIAIVTLNRTEAANALSKQMLLDLACE